MLKRVLIANRGEIARRVARTCRRLGVEYVAVHSDADATAAHLTGAVDVVRIGPGPATDSYLSIPRLVEAALATGCDSVHPGYGFLSENPDFAAAVTDAGLVYIGPGPDTICAMGDKATARALMGQAGVPILPGSPLATESPEVLAADAGRIGYPVILKPVAGGGGKGMRVVTEPGELAAAVAESVRLARSSFGDGRLLAERYVSRPRHIEVQVFGDTFGHVVHLYERECSLQRRHQKIVEEAPAADLPASVRDTLLAAAVRGAASIGYVNAGTFEFILDPDGHFYFLEANTRLQVEHPVTEEITGVDLVEWQLRVAAGEPLPLTQDRIGVTGHAIECRVYAEDPDAGFQPAPGTARVVRWPGKIRVEAAFDRTGVVSSFYDPMIAKLIARGPDRSSALRRLRQAVRDTRVVGLTTNLGFVGELLDHPRVVAGLVDTHLVDAIDQFTRSRTATAAACVAAVQATSGGDLATSPWNGSVGPLDRQDLDPAAPLGRVVTVEGHDTHTPANIVRVDADGVCVEVDGRRIDVTVTRRNGLHEGTADTCDWSGLRTPSGYEIVVDGYRVALGVPSFTVHAADTAGDVVRSGMPGAVVALPVAVGDTISAGDVVAVVEAMKMETPLPAPRSGVIAGIRCTVGDVVAADQVLIDLEPIPDTGPVLP
ncbi:biotin carboxylase N-terminal domain-containing protein [Kineosporia sp. NBRC 101731]|uniref:acetyl/propionyl/methylcrotonyl-CoA carboxylase subunit alpha n=1 Tax=Kineosporia sp. NBRC 101731 TaxID=3032199 RepID=UPI0024A43AB4|nr:biotin carboxylase N-terminal domain-containing protein [Kineosporia sp. NBRC 101731]GLY30939.1 acetyl/propionyl-CoA carboxylase subuit alpha [Kineosporia sp. NBRC 101731]